MIKIYSLLILGEYQPHGIDLGRMPHVPGLTHELPPDSTNSLKMISRKSSFSMIKYENKACIFKDIFMMRIFLSKNIIDVRIISYLV
jgi:hypothetical protein